MSLDFQQLLSRVWTRDRPTSTFDSWDLYFFLGSVHSRKQQCERSSQSLRYFLRAFPANVVHFFGVPIAIHPIQTVACVQLLLSDQKSCQLPKMGREGKIPKIRKHETIFSPRSLHSKELERMILLIVCSKRFSRINLFTVPPSVSGPVNGFLITFSPNISMRSCVVHSLSLCVCKYGHRRTTTAPRL